MPERTPEQDDQGPRPRRFSLDGLARKPLIIPTCYGEVIISSEKLKGKTRVTVKTQDIDTTTPEPLP